MEEITTIPPVEEATPPIRLGATLREKRLAMGLSVADVAAQIRLAPRQIEALEADDFSRLPELPFVRGFVRSYAKLLQLDELPLLATLPNPHAVSERIEPVSVDVPFNMTQLSKQQNKVWLIATAVVAVMALAFAGWHFATPQVAKVEAVEKTNLLESNIVLPEQIAAESAVVTSAESAVESTVAAVSASPLPAVTPMLKSATNLLPAVSAVNVISKPTTAASAIVLVLPTVIATSTVAPMAASAVAINAKLRIVFEGESWAEISDESGKILSSQLNAAGSELNINGKAPYELVIGHANNVKVYRRGKLVDLTAHINKTSEVARMTVE